MTDGIKSGFEKALFVSHTNVSWDSMVKWFCVGLLFTRVSSKPAGHMTMLLSWQ